jgi:hypothetical protein
MKSYFRGQNFAGSSIMTPVPHQGTVLVDLMMDGPEYISVDEKVIIIKGGQVYWEWLNTIFINFSSVLHYQVKWCL